MHNGWNKERVNAAIDRFVEAIGPEVARNNKRWTGSYEGWEKRIEGLRRFADGRQAFLKKQFGSVPMLRNVLHMSKEELDRCFED